jgi:rubrerythrin
MATNMNEDKIVETINQIKNTKYPRKGDLISVLQSLIQKMGIAKSADEIMLKAATDDSGKLISQAITYFIGAGSDDPMADSIAGRLKQILISENIKSLKAGNSRDKNVTVKRLQEQYDDVKASLKKSLTYAHSSDPEFDELREIISAGKGSTYRKKAMNDYVSAKEKAAELDYTPTFNEYAVTKDLIETSGHSAEFKAKELEVLKQRHSDELEKAQEKYDLPTGVQKSLESETEKILRDSATPEEFGTRMAKLLGFKKV